MQTSLQQKLKNFFQRYTKIAYKKGAVILRPEETPTGIYYLEKGYVQQYVISAKGDLLVIHLFKPGSFFMMMWAINNTANSYYFEAQTPVEAWRAPLTDVREFVKREPEILYDFTSRLLKGVSGLLKRLELLVLDPAYIKLISLLSYFAKSLGEKNGEDIVVRLPFSHKDIASWIGTTRETTSLQMEALKKKGLINYSRKTLIIKDIGRLEKELSYGAH